MGSFAWKYDRKVLREKKVVRKEACSLFMGTGKKGGGGGLFVFEHFINPL